MSVCVRHREAWERYFGSVKQAFKTLFNSWTHNTLFTWNTPEFLNGVNILNKYNKVHWYDHTYTGYNIEKAAW